MVNKTPVLFLFVVLYGIFSGTFVQAKDAVRPFWEIKKTPDCRVYGCSTFSRRVLNRKHVHHIVMEPMVDRLRLTLLVRHPGWQGDHPLYAEFRPGQGKEAMLLARYIDSYLEGGYNMHLEIAGNVIKKLSFPHTGKEWPSLDGR